MLLSDEFETELSKLGKSSITESEIAEILFGQAENIYQEHRNYRNGLISRLWDSCTVEITRRPGSGIPIELIEPK